MVTAAPLFFQTPGHDSWVTARCRPASAPGCVRCLWTSAAIHVWLDTEDEAWHMQDAP